MALLLSGIPRATHAVASTALKASVGSLNSSYPSKEHLVLSYSEDAFPKGFACSSLHSGIKKKAGVLDLGLLVSTSDKPCSAAACFTRNVFKAAPVVVSTDVLLNHNGRAKALIVNSGCANAVTGKQGMEDAQKMVDAVDSLLEVKEPSTLVVSTGVIGQTLPMEKITPLIPQLHSTLSSSSDAWVGLSKAFMTTDTFPKLRAKSITLPSGTTVRIAGIDKGAGMIHPSMGPPKAQAPLHGTLLGVIATDASISPSALQKALTSAVDRSFNSITVDGDMSTNDTIVAFANGEAGGAELKGQDLEAFTEELGEFAEELAQLVVRDGEGMTKFVTISVTGGVDDAQAKTVAATIAKSSLVKTALYGQDANWGRILCAIGYSPVEVDSILPTSVSVSFLPTDGSPALVLLQNGEPLPLDEERAAEILKAEDLEIAVSLGKGEGHAKYWTCDLTYEYIKINGSYRS